MPPVGSRNVGASRRAPGPSLAGHRSCAKSLSSRCWCARLCRFEGALTSTTVPSERLLRELGGAEWTGVRALFVGGVIAGLRFVVAFLLEGATRPDYDPLRHPVSSLALGPFGWTQTATSSPPACSRWCLLSAWCACPVPGRGLGRSWWVAGPSAWSEREPLSPIRSADIRQARPPCQKRRPPPGRCTICSRALLAASPRPPCRPGHLRRRPVPTTDAGDPNMGRRPRGMARRRPGHVMPSTPPQAPSKPSRGHPNSAPNDTLAGVRHHDWAQRAGRRPAQCRGIEVLVPPARPRAPRQTTVLDAPRHPFSSEPTAHRCPRFDTTELRAKAAVDLALQRP